ncbi:MAG: tetratricopeptide repeat protein [Polyangia bacterium]
MEGDPGGAGADPDVQSLAARLLAGRVVLCAGSALGGRPSFRSLVEQLLSRLGPDGSEARGLLGSRPLWVSGLVKRRLGEQFPSALAEALRGQTGSGEVDGLCARLPFRAVLSTALDDGIGRALGQAAADGGAASPAVYTAATAERVRSEGRGRYVLQLLGDGVSGRDVLFSEAEIDAALRSDGVRGVLVDLAQKRTLLLVGFDPRDPDLELVLSRVLLPAHGGAAHADGPQHFAVLPGLPAGVAEELEAAYGVRVLRDADELGLLRALKAAVGDATGEALPDDDDLLGWLRVLQQEPEQGDAVAKLAAIEERLTEQKDADRLIELWLGRMEVEASAQGRARCLQKVAALFEHDKGQLAEAFHSLLAAYKESPEPALYAEVERLAGASGSWVELLQALRELVPALPLTQRPEAWLRIARLYGDKLSHVEYALASLSEAQRLEVRDAGVRRQMLTLRAELLRRAEKWKDLAETLVQLADALESSDEGKDKRLDLYLEAGEVYETRLSDGISAAAAYKKGRAVDPASRDVLLALEHALRRASNWTDLIALLDDKAAALEGAGDAEGGLRARREAAQLHTEHTTERKASIARWEAVEKAAAETKDVRVEALRALEKLYTAEGGLSDQYLGTLEALADHVPSDKERLTLYRRLVAEHEELPGHTAQAEACLEKILRVDAGAEDAYRGLSRLYRQEKKWPELISTLTRHAAHAASRADTVATWAALAKVHEVDVPAGDAEKLRAEAKAAIAAWQKVLEVEPEHGGAIEALARLFQATEQHEEAVRMLVKRAHLIDDKSTKVGLYNEAARICRGRLGQPQAAEEHFVRALEILPDHVPTAAALADLYRERGEPLRAAKLFAEAAGHTQNRIGKIKFLVEAAHQHLGVEDRERAGELFKQALELDPESADAAQGAVELYLQAGQHEQAVPLLEILTRKEAEPSVTVVRLCRLGQAALLSGLRDKARRAYRRALELVPTHLQALRGLIPLLMETGQFVDAKQACETALREHEASLLPGERAELLATLGAAEHKLGHDEAAGTALYKALEIDPLHPGALQALRQMDSLPPTEKLACRQALLRVLLGQSGEFSTSSPGIAARSGSSPALRDVSQERAALYSEIGDLLAGPLGQPEDAIAAYKDGLALMPGSLTILHKLLEVYGASRMWAEAAGVLEDLVEGEKKESRRARFKQTAALIYRDELGDLPRALKLFHSALDDDSSLVKCLDAIEALATELDDPKELLRAYQRKIKALGPDGADTPKQRAERLRLWTALSRLCLQRLGDPQTGLAAFEVTVALEPANLDRQRQLAAIYSALGSNVGAGKIGGGADLRDKAIEQHQKILVRHKGELASYRALKELYGQTGQRDKAQAVAAALQLLRQGEASDEELVRELRERPLRPATRPLSKELWRLLAHPEEDPRLSALFSLVLKVTLPGHGRPRAELGLGSRNRVDLSGAQFAPKALRYAFEMLDTESPEVYTRAEGRGSSDSEAASEPFRLLVALEKGTPGASPALCAELSPALLDGKRPEREALYEFGRIATLLRPERALRAVYPTAAQLGLIVDSALCAAGVGGAGGSARVQETARGLKGALLQPAQEQLVRIARSLTEGQAPSGEEAAALWLGGSDLTAVRAGFLLCGDLETAALLLATDPPGASRQSPKQRLLELIHFSVTEECFTIRRHLGL